VAAITSRCFQAKASSARLAEVADGLSAASSPRAGGAISGSPGHVCHLQQREPTVMRSPSKNQTGTGTESLQPSALMAGSEHLLGAAFEVTEVK